MKDSLRNIFKKEWHLPLSGKIARVIGAFSLTEKAIFFVLSVILFFSATSLLWQVNKLLTVEVPDYGGEMTEGVIGSPRFINPLLAVSDTDRDLSSLIYSGLLKVGTHGELVTDLAESYNISPDGLTYTFVLKNNTYFHDGTKLTTDDVAFTIQMAKDESLKSPRKANWDGVTVNKVDDRTVQFVLKAPYSPFIQNTTLGILPKHIWKTTTGDEFPFSKFNEKPIGSGPYKVSSVIYSSSGIPSEYHLSSFSKYTLGRPYIETIIIKSFKGEKELADSYKNGDIENLHGISSEDVSLDKSRSNVLVASLPRVFGLFFNQNTANVFVNKEVRQALAMTVDKQAIINTVLNSYGQPIDEPVPPREVAQGQAQFDPQNLENAKALLISKGWKQNSDGIFEKKDKKTTTTLSFSISTGDAPELKKSAMMLAEQWQKMGAKVDVKVFEIGDLNQNVIRPRKYDSLFFGEVIGRDLDLYPFWHSSQRNDPGLNIAMYTNLKADKVLEDIRKSTDPKDLSGLYDKFEQEINSDIPAVFVYSPYFTYIVPRKIHNISLGQLTTASERFANINTWYIETNNVWKIFKK